MRPLSLSSSWLPVSRSDRAAFARFGYRVLPMRERAALCSRRETQRSTRTKRASDSALRERVDVSERERSRKVLRPFIDFRHDAERSVDHPVKRIRAVSRRFLAANHRARSLSRYRPAIISSLTSRRTLSLNITASSQWPTLRMPVAWTVSGDNARMRYFSERSGF